MIYYFAPRKNFLDFISDLVKNFKKGKGQMVESKNYCFKSKDKTQQWFINKEA